MADLFARTPCAGLLPVDLPGLTLREVDPGPVTAIMPYRDRQDALSSALQAAHGLSFPSPNTSGRAGDATVVWAGRAKAFLMGVAPNATLAGAAALVDQSDGWAVIEAQGSALEDVLARLVPVDMRIAAFPEGAVAQTLLAHMAVGLHRTGPQTMRLMVFRSMAETAVHDLVEAGQSVAARQDLPT